MLHFRHPAHFFTGIFYQTHTGWFLWFCLLWPIDHLVRVHEHRRTCLYFGFVNKMRNICSNDPTCFVCVSCIYGFYWWIGWEYILLTQFFFLFLQLPPFLARSPALSLSPKSTDHFSFCQNREWKHFASEHLFIRSAYTQKCCEHKYLIKRSERARARETHRVRVDKFIFFGVPNAKTEINLTFREAESDSSGKYCFSQEWKCVPCWHWIVSCWFKYEFTVACVRVIPSL